MYTCCWATLISRETRYKFRSNKGHHNCLWQGRKQYLLKGAKDIYMHPLFKGWSAKPKCDSYPIMCLLHRSCNLVTTAFQYYDENAWNVIQYLQPLGVCWRSIWKWFCSSDAAYYCTSTRSCVSRSTISNGKYRRIATSCSEWTTARLYADYTSHVC